jgi:hypothetical protein
MKQLDHSNPDVIVLESLDRTAEIVGLFGCFVVMWLRLLGTSMH